MADPRATEHVVARCPRPTCGAPLATDGQYFMHWCERGHPIDARPRCPRCGVGRLRTRRLHGPDEYDCGHLDLLADLIDPGTALTAEGQVLAILRRALDAEGVPAVTSQYVDGHGVERRLTPGVIGYQWEQVSPGVLDRMCQRRELRR